MWHTSGYPPEARGFADLPWQQTGLQLQEEDARSLQTETAREQELNITVMT